MPSSSRDLSHADASLLFSSRRLPPLLQIYRPRSHPWPTTQPAASLPFSRSIARRRFPPLLQPAPPSSSPAAASLLFSRSVDHAATLGRPRSRPPPSPSPDLSHAGASHQHAGTNSNWRLTPSTLLLPPRRGPGGAEIGDGEGSEEDKPPRLAMAKAEEVKATLGPEGSRAFTMRELLSELKEDDDAAGSTCAARSAFREGNEIGSADADGSSFSRRCQDRTGSAFRPGSDPVLFIANHMKKAVPAVITKVMARQILDGRGAPAVEVELHTNKTVHATLLLADHAQMVAVRGSEVRAARMTESDGGQR